FLFRDPQVTAEASLDAGVVDDVLAEVEQLLRADRRGLPRPAELEYLRRHFRDVVQRSVPCAESQLNLLVHSPAHVPPRPARTPPRTSATPRSPTSSTATGPATTTRGSTGRTAPAAAATTRSTSRCARAATSTTCCGGPVDTASTARPHEETRMSLVTPCR